MAELLWRAVVALGGQQPGCHPPPRAPRPSKPVFPKPCSYCPNQAIHPKRPVVRSSGLRSTRTAPFMFQAHPCTAQVVPRAHQNAHVLGDGSLCQMYESEQNLTTCNFPITSKKSRPSRPRPQGEGRIPASFQFSDSLPPGRGGLSHSLGWLQEFQPSHSPPKQEDGGREEGECVCSL